MTSILFDVIHYNKFTSINIQQEIRFLWIYLYHFCTSTHRKWFLKKNHISSHCMDCVLMSKHIPWLKQSVSSLAHCARVSEWVRLVEKRLKHHWYLDQLRYSAPQLHCGMTNVIPSTSYTSIFFGNTSTLQLTWLILKIKQIKSALFTMAANINPVHVFFRTYIPLQPHWQLRDDS